MPAAHHLPSGRCSRMNARCMRHRGARWWARHRRKRVGQMPCCSQSHSNLGTGIHPLGEPSHPPVCPRYLDTWARLVMERSCGSRPAIPILASGQQRGCGGGVRGRGGRSTLVWGGQPGAAPIPTASTPPLVAVREEALLAGARQSAPALVATPGAAESGCGMLAAMGRQRRQRELK